MDDIYKNKYRISPARLKGWDYGSHGLYYITICTKNRSHYFGEIEKGENETAFLNRTEIADVAESNWFSIPEFHPYVEVDSFVLMPNHLHGILFINRPDKLTWSTNKFGPQSKNLASILRGYKSSVTQYAKENAIEFVWQPRYYDHIIRNQKEYENIVGYIYNNPHNWLLNGDVIEDM
ncbi:transposase [Mucilaginibacter psychrotolerans]|uniref:Transposase IS200-like domain-containing protein n=1 Tax=Mucilaginibacter psychrotolerans TaxID=1524096 RepID=A0A4Y8S7W9_9SPHI|nr:transposase [Mucilaginibacter psychrotolerans]TFF35058.1 hypothetical protein E2R66_20150 [Mucilaginibacter psychrotolerans]